MLQKNIEDRKLLEEGIIYAATPKISAMNFLRSLTAPFPTPVATTEGTSKSALAQHFQFALSSTCAEFRSL